MRIKKQYSTVVPNGKILNMSSTSQTDTYSCKKIEDRFDEEVGELSNLETTDKSNVVNAINELKSKVLWTNPNPTKSFAEQTIQLDLRNYEAIEIIFSTLASGTTRQTFGKILVGYGAKYTTHDWIAGVGEALIFRALTTSTTGVSFNNAFDVKLSDGTIPSQVNNYLIPYTIIGYK